MSEVNELLDKLGKLEEAPLIWINKKVYDNQEEIQRLKFIIKELEKYIEESKHLASGVYEFKGSSYMFYYNKTDDLLDKLQQLKGSDKE